MLVLRMRIYYENIGHAVSDLLGFGYCWSLQVSFRLIWDVAIVFRMFRFEVSQLVPQNVGASASVSMPWFYDVV